MSKKKKTKIKGGPSPMVRRFYFKRTTDDSGISGTGRVAAGVQWPSGKVSVEWLSEVSSHEEHNNIEECIQVHSHGGHTVIEWVDVLDLQVVES